MKKTIVRFSLTVAMSFLAIVAGNAGTVSVSSTTNMDVVATVPPRAIVPIMDLSLDADGFQFFQGVNFVLQQRTAFSDSDATLYLGYGGKISRITSGNSLMSIGPAYVGPNAGPMPLQVTIYAAVKPTGASPNPADRYSSFDLVGLTVDGYSTVHNSVSFAGTFPILGHTYLIDTNMLLGSLLIGEPHGIKHVILAGGMSVIGGFSANALRETSSLDGFELSINASIGNFNEVTNICIIDEEGNVVARPSSMMIGEKISGLSLAFDGPFTVPLGQHEYRVCANLGQGFNGASVQTQIPYVGGYIAYGETSHQWFSPEAKATGYGPKVMIAPLRAVRPGLHH